MIRDSQQLPWLVRVSQFPSQVPFLERLGTPARFAASSASMILLRCASPDELAHGGQANVHGRGAQFFLHHGSTIFHEESARESPVSDSRTRVNTSSSALAYFCLECSETTEFSTISRKARIAALRFELRVPPTKG